MVTGKGPFLLGRSRPVTVLPNDHDIVWTMESLKRPCTLRVHYLSSPLTRCLSCALNRVPFSHQLYLGLRSSGVRVRT